MGPRTSLPCKCKGYITYKLFLSCFIEIPSPAVAQGAKHATLPSANKEMDPKGAAALLERRRVSASVSELQDLYSALQELVPGGTACSISHRTLKEEENPTDVSSNPNSPRPRRRSPNSGSKGRRNLSRSPTNEDESLRVRRLLPVTPQSPSNQRKFHSKTTQALDVNANQSLTKGKRAPDIDRRGSSGEVLLSMETSQKGKPSPNMGRRGSSGEVLLGVRANQIKAPISPLAMTRSASSQDIYRAVQSQTRPKSPAPLSSFKLDRLVSPEVLARRGSEGVLYTPNMDKHHKKPSPLKMGRRGSSGDILSSENSRIIPIPRSPLASPKHNTMFEPHSQGTGSDSSSGRSTLKNAIAKFSHSFKKKTPPASPEPRETSPTMTVETNESISHSDVVDGLGQPKKLTRLESQMDLLLNSLNDLQGSSKEPLHASMSDPMCNLDQRRGSLGTEMQELLGALQELSAMGPGSDSDSLGENESRSRGTSESHDRAPVQRESLDQLEAYFTEKLRDATRAEASKTSSERSSESEAPHSDKEDGDLQQPNSELSSKKTSLEVGSVDEGIDLVDHPIHEGLPTDSEGKRAHSKEDRDEFANQVNIKLQVWLEKAMTLAQKEKDNFLENEHFTTSESEELKYDSLDSDGSDGNKDKEPKRIKRNIFNKLSFLRRGHNHRRKFRHRRTRSMHDVFFTLESERQFQDGDAAMQPETSAAEEEKKSRRPSTVTRSRSLYNVGRTRSKNSSKQVKEADDLPTTTKYRETNAPVPMPEHVEIQRSDIVTSSSKETESTPARRDETPTTAERPEVNTTPKHQQSEDKKGKHLTTPKTRLCRLPTDLPFFYSPEPEKSCDRQENVKQTNTQSLTRNRKKLFSQNGVIYTGMEDSFYTEKPREDKKLKKTTSNTLPYPRILVNESCDYFFGNRIEGHVTLVYPDASPPGSPVSPLRRFASMDSFLNSKDLQDCEAPGTNGSSHYGNELLADGAARNHLLRRVSDDQSPCPSPPSHVWDMEVTI